MGERVHLDSVPVMSDRRYTPLRVRTETNLYEYDFRPTPRYVRAVNDGKHNAFYVLDLFVDDATGIVTTDVAAFEKWIGER